MTSEKNRHLHALGLPPEATLAEAKAEYRDLAFIYHPDRLGDSERLKVKGAAKFIAVKEAYEALVRIFEEEEKTKAARPRRSPREKQAGGPPGGATRADPGTKTGGASRREDEPVDKLLRSFDALVKRARAADYPFPVGHKFGIRRRALADFAGAARRVGLLGQRLERWNAIRPSIIELLERARLAGAAAPTEAILAPDGLEQFRRLVVQTEDVFARVRRLQIRRSKLAERANAAGYPGQIASDEDVDRLARSSASEANAELDKLEASVTYWSTVRSEALALQARIPAAGGQVDLRLCLGPNGLSGFRQAVTEAEASAQPRSRNQVLAMRVGGVVLAVAILLGLHVSRIARDQELCRECRELDSVNRWSAYLAERPAGACAEEAGLRLRQIPCEVALSADTLEGWTRILERESDPPCLEPARNRVREIPCELLEAENSVSAWTTYLAQEPRGDCAERAKSRMNEIPCERSRATDQVDVWREYLEEYPIGPCRDEARQRIEALPCETALAHDSYSGWQGYLETYGVSGKCSATASERIQQLACGAPRSLSTRDGWERFLVSQPNAGPCDVYAVSTSADLDEVAMCESILSVLFGDLLEDDATPTPRSIDLPCLTSVGGAMWIGGSFNEAEWVTNLDMPNLTSVGGNLGIEVTSLTNLDGLSSLTSVGGDLAITSNDVLTDISGLSSLTSVGGDLNISNNDALTDISGLSNLTAVGGALSIANNPALCQSLVDAFVAACSSCSVGNISNNLDGC
jgi:hypothetical protein